MVVDSKKAKLELVQPPEDASDIAALWLDPALGDGLVNVHFHVVPVGKPRDFFRVNPDPAYRRLCEIYTHKVEGQVDETNYIITKPMQGVIDEARRCTLVTCIYRDGSPRLWPLKLPRDGEKDYAAWITARSAAKTAMDKWVRLVWRRGVYDTRDAAPGYAPEPDWSKLPPGLPPAIQRLIRRALKKDVRQRLGDIHDVKLDIEGAVNAPPRPGEAKDSTIGKKRGASAWPSVQPRYSV